jgi:hypothetical protein
MDFLAAYTDSQAEPNSCVGFINLSREGDTVKIILRPKSNDGLGAVSLDMSVADAKVLLVRALNGLFVE